MKLRLRLNKIKIKGTTEKSTMCDISRKQMDRLIPIHGGVLGDSRSSNHQASIFLTGRLSADRLP
jgi:hypothetical protein